jgi:probable rRNA maturation factor
LTAAGAAQRLEVAVQFAARRPWVPPAASLRKWARAACRAGVGARRGPPGRKQPAIATELCVRIVGRASSRRLNRDYRGKDKPTNVLSFPSDSLERAAGGSFGDIVICAPVVAAEAGQQGKSLPEHWAHMVVHGVLHLLGYDHLGPRQARAMEALEVAILREFGYPDPYRPATSLPA